MHFPTDYAYADKFSEDNKTVIRIYKDGIDNGQLGLDIGLNSIKTNSDVIKNLKKHSVLLVFQNKNKKK